MALPYAQPNSLATMQAPQRAYIQTAQGPIAYNPAMASAAVAPLGSGMTSHGSVPSAGYGMGVAGGVGAVPAAAGMGMGGMGVPQQNYYTGTGGNMAALSGAGES